ARHPLRDDHVAIAPEAACLELHARGVTQVRHPAPHAVVPAMSLGRGVGHLRRLVDLAVLGERGADALDVAAGRRVEHLPDDMDVGRVHRVLLPGKSTTTMEDDVKIKRSSIDTAPGPSEWFTGNVYIDTVAEPEEPSRVSAINVHFTPGARTAWHTHTNGQ